MSRVGDPPFPVVVERICLMTVSSLALYANRAVLGFTGYQWPGLGNMQIELQDITASSCLPTNTYPGFFSLLPPRHNNVISSPASLSHVRPSRDDLTLFNHFLAPSLPQLSLDPRRTPPSPPSF